MLTWGGGVKVLYSYRNGSGDLEGIYKDITRMCEYVVGWSGMSFQRAQCLNPDTSLGWKRKNR
jgi:hypothetical protein